MKKLTLFLVLNIIAINLVFSQSGVSVNATGAFADNSAILDVSSTAQGLLIPRMTTVQRDAIVSPALSLLIFNTTTNCFEAYVNGLWFSFGCHQCESGCSQMQLTFGGSGDDYLTFVKQTRDGGYIMTGSTNSFGAGGYDVYLMKTDGSGNLEWSKTIGGTSYDVGLCVKQTSDGGYIVSGITSSFGAGVMISI
jgi:hypothetical protein